MKTKTKTKTKKNKPKIDNSANRGKKQCPNCTTVNGARQRYCTYCKYEFPFKNYSIKNEIIDWRNLTNGEFIKIVPNTGPYYDLRNNPYKESHADRHYMGEKGVYKVIKIDDKGILCYGASLSNAGYCHIYMGQPYKSQITGINFEPHRILRVKSKRMAEIKDE